MQKKYIAGNGSILIPFLTGGLVGAGLGILMAPKPGKAIRRDLNRFARNTKDYVSDAIDTGKELYGDGKEAVLDTVESGKKTFAEGKKRLEALTHREERSLTVPILTAGIVGAGVALLLTTKAGKDLRKDLKRAAEDTLDRVSSAVDRGTDFYEEGKEAVADTMKAGKKAFLAGKEKLRQVI